MNQWSQIVFIYLQMNEWRSNEGKAEWVLEVYLRLQVYLRSDAFSTVHEASTQYCLHFPLLIPFRRENANGQSKRERVLACSWRNVCSSTPQRKSEVRNLSAEQESRIAAQLSVGFRGALAHIGWSSSFVPHVHGPLLSVSETRGVPWGDGAQEQQAVAGFP